MSKHVFVTVIRAIGLVLGLAVTLWFINLDLKHSMMHFSLERQGNASQAISVFFIGKDNPGYLERAQLAQLKERAQQKETVFLPIPKHVDVNRAVLRVEGSASDWRVHKVGVFSRFFIFDLLAYEWPLTSIESAAPKSDLRLQIQNGAITFPTSSDPLALRFALNDNSLVHTKDLILAKLFFIAGFWLVIYWLFFSSFIWSMLGSRTQDYRVFEVGALADQEQNKYLALLSALLFIVVIVILRYPIIAEPGILIEDAMEMSDVLSGAAHPLNPDSYFYYRGYYVFLTEVIAQFTSLFPFQWQPAMYLWFGLLTSCLAFCLFTYSGLFKSRLILLTAPIFFCLGSFSGPLMYLTITSILFSSTILLMAISIRPAPNTTSYLLVYAVLIFVLAWSGPYTPQLIPLSVALLLLHASGKKTIVLILMTVLGVLYTLSAASGMVQFENIYDSTVRVGLFTALVRYVFLMELAPQASYEIGLLFILGIIAVMFAFRKDRTYLKHSIAFLGASLASLATYFISFKYHIYSGVLLDSHTVIAQFCWLVFVLLTLDKVLAAVANKPLNIALSFSVCLAFVGFLYPKTSVQKNDYVLVVDKTVPSFMQAIEQAHEVELAPGEFLQLWHINQFKQVTSVYFGDTSSSATSVDVDQLPEGVRAFAIPFSLDRDLNNILYYDPRANTIGYSHTGRTKTLPAWDKP